jgi:uncharacterized membrane protein
VSSRKTSKNPPARVIVMIVMLAVMTGALFGLIAGSWVVGGGVGLVFAAGVYFVAVYQARRATVKRSRRRR